MIAPPMERSSTTPDICSLTRPTPFAQNTFEETACPSRRPTRRLPPTTRTPLLPPMVVELGGLGRSRTGEYDRAVGHDEGGNDACASDLAGDAGRNSAPRGRP